MHSLRKKEPGSFLQNFIVRYSNKNLYSAGAKYGGALNIGTGGLCQGDVNRQFQRKIA